MKLKRGVKNSYKIYAICPAREIITNTTQTSNGCPIAEALF